MSRQGGRRERPGGKGGDDNDSDGGGGEGESGDFGASGTDGPGADEGGEAAAAEGGDGDAGVDAWLISYNRRLKSELGRLRERARQAEDRWDVFGLTATVAGWGVRCSLKRCVRPSRGVD